MGQKSPEVDLYIIASGPVRRTALETLRDLIHETRPEVVETFAYGMPTFEVDGPLCAMASQKRYISFYCNTDAVAKHRAGLGNLNVGKSCIRFTKIENAPLDVFRLILKDS